MSKTFKCGCVDGHYWCSAHDIYTKSDPNNPVPFGLGLSAKQVHEEYMQREYPDDYEPGGCSCHLTAPCRFCVSTLGEDDE